jgi:hypothetical protein
MGNKHLLRLFAFVMLAVLPLTLLSGEIRTGEAKTALRLMANTYQELSFTNTVSSMQFRDVNTKLGTFTELFIEGHGYSNDIGSPKLPVYRRLIEVPVGASFDITITKEEYDEYDCAVSGIAFRVIPAQAPVSKAITDPAQIPFEYNAQAYQQNTFLGGPLVTVTLAGRMRAVTIARIDVAPVQYNPVTGKLRIYRTIEAKVTFAGADIAATLNMKNQLASPYFEKAYRMLGNYKPENDQLITTSPVTYVIVSDPMFQQALQPFIHWKTRKGFKVIQGYTNDPNVGTTKTSIKAYLQGLYNTPPAGYNAPSFVLFVGDVAQIPAWTNNGQPTDLRYCEYTGDNIPEVYYGRFSATNVSQLQPQIDKTLEYEQYLFPNEHFLDTCTMVAGADAAHQMTWGNGQINYGTTYYFNTAHNLIAHIYLQPEPGGANYSQQIRNDVSDGVCYSNYTAHGSENGWADPSFTIGNIAALQNAHKYPLMVGNCCLTSKYSVNSFAEELLRAADKGALGYIGASNNSYWDEDFWWGCGFKAISANPVYNPAHLGAYDVTFHDQGEAIQDWYVTQGQMVVGGNMAVEESSTSSGTKLYYWEIYCLMGDPSLSVYFSVPPALTATYADPLLVGSTTLNVTTEPYAYIGLSSNDTSFIAAQCADSLGQAVLNFDPLSVPGYIDIVITKQNRKPILDSIQVIPASGAYLTIATFAVNDSAGGNNDHNADFSETVQLDLTVGNIGILTAYNVSSTITTSDTNIIITDNFFVFDSVPAGGTATGAGAFTIVIKNNVADQHKATCNVTFTDGNDTWNSTLILNLDAPLLAIGGMTVLDPAPGGNNNGVLDPGETAQLKVNMINNGHAPVGNGIAILSVDPGSAPFIIVNNPNYYIGDLPVNGFVSAYFDVITNGITPIGTILTLPFSETAGAANQYFAQKNFELEVGQILGYNMMNGNLTTCLANFYDSGGPEGNYSDNEDLTMTFNAAATGAQLQVDFSAFDLEASSGCTYDYLKIYDGPNTTSPLLGTWCGTDGPGTLTSTNGNGALTFQFHSDYSEVFAGWESQVKCIGGPLTLIANAFPPQVCTGSSSQLIAMVSGGTGTYSYLWEPATYLDDPTSSTPISTPEADITYTVTVNDGSTTLTSSPVEITLLPVPDPAFVIQTGNLLESSVADGNQWYINGAMIPGATGQTYEATSQGTYYTIITDAVTGCQSEPSNTAVILGTGEPGDPGSVQIFPNPFRDRLNVSFSLPESGMARISLIDAYGREAARLEDKSNVPAGAFSGSYGVGILNPGVYFCRIQSGSFITVKKVILSR